MSNVQRTDDPKNQEDVVRDVRDYLNKNSKPEDCWSLNISWAISQYLQLLDGVEEESENVSTENLDLFEGGSHHLRRPAGINFCLAGSLLFDATRAFAKKVDYLGATLNSTLSNLTAGNIQGTKLKKSRNKKGARNAKGLHGMSGWILPEVPESIDLMHLPWTSLSTKNGADLLLYEEVKFHEKALQVLNEPDGTGGVEGFAERLLSAPIRHPEVPLCIDPRAVAEQRQICLSRPAICLMPRTQPAWFDKSKDTLEARNAFDPRAIADLLDSHKLTGCPMDEYGALYLPFLNKRLCGASPAMVRIDHGSTRSVSGVFEPMPTPATCSGVLVATAAPATATGTGFPEPRASILRSSINGGASDPPQPVVSAALAAAGVKKTPLTKLDEHQVLGKDCPLKVGSTCNTLKSTYLYNMKLPDIDCPEVIALLAMDPRAFMSLPPEEKLRIFWNVNEWKIRRQFKARPRGQKPWNSIEKELALNEVTAKLKLNLACHPIFEEVRTSLNPLEPYLLDDPCFAAISDTLRANLQKKAGTLKDESVSEVEVGRERDFGENEAKRTPEFEVGEGGIDSSVWCGGDKSIINQALQAASTLAERVSIVCQAQTPQLQAPKTEQKSSLFELHQR
eukprot:Gregarina_sp_Poly_1__11075@NODE_890_length_5837_cov_53_476430_g634_i0_p1_GENE_NODE_890_length_5837_cov_53_476430_g634_i0NODE_890_length_5837_cov_53_476430_g634_i0_p1_ORF_typecomplete_len622_score97_88CNDH2_N/PF06278_11/7e09Rad21_Rec8_N/PF04825_13/0_14_NODE_890_length_5837_cov_53_476430_g634_i03702235